MQASIMSEVVRVPAGIGLDKMVSYKETPRLNYEDGQYYVQVFSWGMVSEEQIELLTTFFKGKSLLEVFSGTGYLAYQINKRLKEDVRHVAYDTRTWSNFKESRFKQPYYGSKKNAFMAPIKSFDVVMMVWPTYEVNHAYKVANKMISGQYLIYQGENWGGCCADDDFFELLENEFELQEEITDQLNEYQIAWCSESGVRMINEEFLIYKKR